MLNTFGLILSLSTFIIADNTYQVFRIYPENDFQLTLLQQMENDYESISYWKRPISLLRETDVMVAPRGLGQFMQVMTINNFRYDIYIDDVEGMLATTLNNRIPPPNSSFGWTYYHSLDEIYTWMQLVSRRYPQFIEQIEVGLSFEQRPIKGLKLSYTSKRKPGIFIEGGIHPREWISPATATYLLNQLLTSNERSIINLIEKYDWYFFPVFNPDGYAFTHANQTNIVNRFWRKTRSYNRLGAENSENTTSKGTDMNHNWSYRWTNAGTNGNPFSENYAGWEAFSEIEAKSLASYISSISTSLFAYISLRGYGQTLMFPSESTYDCKFDFKHQMSIAEKVAQVVKKKHKKVYKYGTLNKMTASAYGTSVQWVKANYKIPLVFAFEMRDVGKYGLILPPYQIIPNAEEVMLMLTTLLKKASTY